MAAICIVNGSIPSLNDVYVHVCASDKGRYTFVMPMSSVLNEQVIRKPPLAAQAEIIAACTHFKAVCPKGRWSPQDHAF